MAVPADRESLQRPLAALAAGVVGASVGPLLLLLASGLLPWLVGAVGEPAARAYGVRYAMRGAVLGGMAGFLCGGARLRWPVAALLGAGLAGGWTAAQALIAATHGVFQRNPGILWEVPAFIFLEASAVAGAAAAAILLVRWAQRSAHVASRVAMLGVVAAACWLGVAGVIGGARYYVETVLSQRAAQRFAAAFAMGDRDVLLEGLAYRYEPGVTRDQAKQWLALLGPYMPKGGRATRLRVLSATRGRRRELFEIVGPGPRGSKEGPGTHRRTLQVEVRYLGACEWRLLPAELPVVTYLAGLYGEEAGKHWQQFLLAHPTPPTNPASGPPPR